jgi:hypothetical protein
MSDRPHVVTVTENGIVGEVDITAECLDVDNCATSEQESWDIPNSWCAFAEQVDKLGSSALDVVEVAPGLTLFDVMLDAGIGDESLLRLAPGRYEVTGIGYDDAFDETGDYAFSHMVADRTVRFLPGALTWIRRRGQ